MNILVLGGTGFMGPHVIRTLVADGHLVTVFARGNLRPELPTDVQCVTGDYKKLPEYRDQFHRLAPEVVLDMIPITEQDALNVVATFRGIARRLVVASSQVSRLGLCHRQGQGPSRSAHYRRLAAARIALSISGPEAADLHGMGPREL